MKKIRNYLLLLGLLVMIAHIPFSCQRIDAGHAGIKVKLYGTDKGVNDVTEVTGMVWFNPYTTEVYEVPTFVQTAHYTRDESEGSDKNEEFAVTTKDGMSVTFDITMNYYNPSEAVVGIFKKYRKPVSELEKGIIKTHLKDAFNNIANQYTADGLYEKRSKKKKKSEEQISRVLGKEGFVVEEIVISGDIRFPKGVKSNIDAKVKATQIALKKQQEVQQAIYDAQKKVEKARGDSSSQVIRAAGEAQAYKLRQKELTSELIQMEFVQSWDGKLPVYGELPTLFKNVSTRK